MNPAVELPIIIDHSIREFQGIAEEDWIKKSNPSKWSKKQILGHLVDSAVTNLRRFVVTQYEQKQKIIYRQDQWVDLQNYQEADLGELIELWRLLNLRIAKVIKDIPGHKLQNVCDTGKEATEYHTLEFLVADYLEHLNHHLRQIVPHKLNG